MQLDPTKDFGENLALYNQVRIGYPATFIQAVFDEFHIPPHYTGVEIGSGSGQLTRTLLDITIKPERLYCIEPDARSIEFSRKRFAALPQIHYINKKLEELESQDIAAGTCDLMIAGDVGHWLEPEMARKQFCGLLKPQGRVIFFNRFIERELEQVGKSLHVLLMQHCDFYKTLIETLAPTKYYNVIFERNTTYYRTQRDYKQWSKKELFDYLKTNSPTAQWVKMHEADVYTQVIDPLFNAYGKNELLTVPWKQTILTGTLRRQV